MAAASYIEGAHGFPMETALIGDKLYSVVESAKARLTCKDISPQYAANCYCTVMYHEASKIS